jgi:DNA helicase-2/ATP-dependent DNA helicase PcrA
VSRLLLELFNGQRSIAVLSRHHETLDRIRDACDTLGIPHDSNGGLPFEEIRQMQMIRRWLGAAIDLHDDDALLGSLAEAGENEPWRQRAIQCKAFGISLWELLWQMSDLSEDDAEFFQFILRLNQLLRGRRFSDAVAACFDRTGFFSEFCEGSDPVRTGRMLEALRLLNTIKEAEKHSDTDRQTLLDFFRSGQEARKAKTVTLSTIHASKGLEFDAAIIVDCTDGVLPQFLTEDEEEERRLFYVALTRAVNRLVLCFNQSNPSRFLREITTAGETDFIQLNEG